MSAGHDALLGGHSCTVNSCGEAAGLEQSSCLDCWFIAGLNLERYFRRGLMPTGML